jgi:hypothetical protein
LKHKINEVQTKITLFFQTAIAMTFNCGGRGRDYKRLLHSTLTATTCDDKITKKKYRTIILYHQNLKAHPSTKMSCISNTLQKINDFYFRILNRVSN